MTVKIFLSHDVDYSITGPTEQHILDRQDRFPRNEFFNWMHNRESLYCNIDEVVRIEERLGVRSTFFFRPFYETGKLEDYSDIINELVGGGWEIGLHVNNWQNLTAELKKLQSITPHTIRGSRCHYLRYDTEMYEKLFKLGIKYDSSIMQGKLSPRSIDTQIMNFDGVTIFPITIAECFLFSYQNASEQNIITKFKEALEMTEKANGLMTVVWHDSSLKMFGGRMYEKVLEYLLSQDVKIATGIECYAATKKS